MESPIHLAVDVNAKISPWLVSKLIKGGIDPYVSLELVATKEIGIVDSITHAEQLMINKIESALLAIAQNASREDYQPPPDLPLEPEVFLADLAREFPYLSRLVGRCSRSHLTRYLQILKKCLKWYPVGSKCYITALDRMLSSLETFEEIDTFVEREIELITEGIFMDTVKSNPLQCPRVLFIETLQLNNYRQPKTTLDDYQGQLGHFVIEL